MPFTYPGIDNLTMIENGDETTVTDGNYGEYVRLIEEFTCGKRLAPLRKQFCRGLFSIVEDGVWNCLTAREKAQMISGNPEKLGLTELRENIIFGPRYETNAPQREMLLETIADLGQEQQQKLVKFITGCERLPIGGLAALTPKITVAKRIPKNGKSPDEALPTASTCVHYFKLPPYSSKDVMRDRLEVAITAGYLGFDLS
jgi:E3 ubiquitin-protein ligase TRIP12